MKTRFELISAFLFALFCISGCKGVLDLPSNATTPQVRYGKALVTGISRTGNAITLVWTEPTDDGFDHVLISYTNDASGSSWNALTPTAGVLTETITMSGSCCITLKAVYSDSSVSEPETILLSEGDKTYTIIRTAAELDDVRNHLAGDYILMEDIDLGGYSSGAGWTPIGVNSLNPFTGTFNGSGHVVNNLHINGTDYAGLFGASQGTITNCATAGSIQGSSYLGGLIGWNEGNVDNCHSTVNVESSGNVSGGLIGYNNGGAITDCYALGNVQGHDNTGGLIGQNSGDLDRCHASGWVNESGSDNKNIGGLIGRHDSGTITNSYAEGFVGPQTVSTLDPTCAGQDDIGGFVGFNTGTIEDCRYSGGDIYASGDAVGGFAGYNVSSGTIRRCRVEADWTMGVITVAQTNYAGGFVGINYGTIDSSYANVYCYGPGNNGGLVGYNDGTISNSYSLGKVSHYGRADENSHYTAGLVAMNYGGTIENCYAAAYLSQYSADSDSDYDPANDLYAGGLVASGATAASYYDYQAAGIPDPTATDLNAKTTAEMQTQTTFAGWDFAATWAMDGAKNNGYPYLVSNPPYTG